jgi:hypothetical protein
MTSVRASRQRRLERRDHAVVEQPADRGQIVRITFGPRDQRREVIVGSVYESQR